MERPKLHITPDKNWMNDPNGFIWYKGKYHLFYQHFPYAPKWGTMHWGHAVSDDLIHWEHLGIALFPTKSYDANGIFSGNSIEIDGKMVLYYTGVKYLAQDPENCHIALHDLYECSQVRIESEDGYHFDKSLYILFSVMQSETTILPRIPRCGRKMILITCCWEAPIS